MWQCCTDEDDKVVELASKPSICGNYSVSGSKCNISGVWSSAAFLASGFRAHWRSQSPMGSDFGILQRRTLGSWFLASSWNGGGRWVRTALALLVPGYGQCCPFALSNQSSPCGHFSDIYPVIYVMSLGQDLGLKGWETLCCGARFQKSLLPLECCIVPAWTRKAPPVGISLRQAKEPQLIA